MFDKKTETKRRAANACRPAAETPLDARFSLLRDSLLPTAVQQGLNAGRGLVLRWLGVWSPSSVSKQREQFGGCELSLFGCLYKNQPQLYDILTHELEGYQCSIRVVCLESYLTFFMSGMACLGSYLTFSLR